MKILFAALITCSQFALAMPSLKCDRGETLLLSQISNVEFRAHLTSANGDMNSMDKIIFSDDSRTSGQIIDDSGYQIGTVIGQQGPVLILNFNGGQSLTCF